MKSEIKSLLVVIVLAVFIRTFCLELFYVPTGSMKATILEGDYIFSTKYNYGYSIYSIPFNPDLFEGRIFASQPELGDVIIMRPPHNMQERYIKRLFGLPGDKIEVINDLIYINDTPIKRVEVGDYIDESGTIFRKFKEILPNGCSYFSYKNKYPSNKFAVDHSNFGPHIVEPGHYFFIGDNRDNSGDSRYQLGTVPFKNLIAKGQFVFFSTKQTLWDSKETFWGQIKRFGTWFMSIRFNRFFSSLYEPNNDNKR
ncbi:MAG: signal peptidase I [Rickettsiaceae bacterium]